MANGTPRFVRHEARSPAGEAAVQAYAAGVRVMKERDTGDPTSWGYQAAIHGTYTEPTEDLWNECEHESWFFFPWHRIFLYYFERIVRKAVVDAGGDEDWALPYWNYGLEGDHGKLPDPFRSPADEGNPLFVPDRKPIRNAGGAIEGMAKAEADALKLRQFIGNAMFGGEKGPAKARFWQREGVPEGTPHGQVHVEIGGWMEDPEMAAADPIFWLHHANIDRIWAVWNEREGGANPNESAWLTQEFKFIDADGKPAGLTSADVLETSQIDYTYDPDPAT